MTAEIELPPELIHDGIRFLRTLTEVYGTDEGMAIWDKMGTAFPDDLRGRIFFAMLTGQTGRHINVSAGRARANSNAISTIKCIREYTKLGLKEAKDLWDASQTGTVSIECDPRVSNEFSRELRSLGCTVT